MKEKDTDTYVSVLMEKIVVNDDVYLFKPLHVLEGEYVSENSLFIDKYGKTYGDVLKSHIGLDESTEFFGFPVSLSELRKDCNCKSKKKAISIYLQSVFENIYIGKMNEDVEKAYNENLTFLYMPVKELEQFFINGSLEENADVDENTEGNYEPAYVIGINTIKHLLELENIEDIKNALEQMFSACNEAVKAAGIGENIAEETLEKDVDSHQELSSAILENPEEVALPFDVNDLYNYVKSKVINQDDAIKRIIMAFSMNYLTVVSNELEDMQLARCLITGPTGIGKTLIVETIIEYLEKVSNAKIPMVKVPTSQLTVAGYIGMNLEEILAQLVNKTPNDIPIEKRIAFAEKYGVVYFDEIDKKGSKSNGDVTGRGVLNSLLEFIDGATYTIYANGNPFHFNTKYLNILASGAFTNVSEQINKKHLGFVQTESKDEIKKPTTDDYIKKGEMPSEFIGRFKQIVELNPLDSDGLKRILTDSISSPILIEQQKLELTGSHLAWDDSFIDAVARKAYSLRTGARSLGKIIEDSLFELKWQALTCHNGETFEVTEKTVEDSKIYRKI